MKVIQDLPGRERFDLLGSKGSNQTSLTDIVRCLNKDAYSLFDSDDLISEN